ncbi:MAG TPA: Mur ligase family protein, partial [Kofleriaceae bacterium]|nr:Mur ligase family protein [Kofleriaceae bacterium]
MPAYADVLARLAGARRFGVKLGLDRMQALLAALGHPEQRLGLVIHVGGTNGKGSVVAMIAALAGAAGKRVATYTSPHLSTLRERVVIDSEMASEAQIVAAAERVSAVGGDQLTFFEQITAIAMLIIAAAEVDVTVLEVGLGGRLDATNVVPNPLAAVITSVALDHEKFLGATITAIAHEKAGILK